MPANWDRGWCGSIRWGEPGSLLRVWDRVDGRLRERALDADRAQSLVLGLPWVVAPAREFGKALRIATHGEPLALVPTQTKRAEPRKLESANSKRCWPRAIVTGEFFVRRPVLEGANG
jgi:hypothetical protein